MIYKDYAEARERLSGMRKLYSEILAEKEELFQMTQPKMDAETLTFAQYMVRLQESGIEERLAETERMIVERERFLGSLAEELKTSKDTTDRIFYLREVRHLRVNQIASSTGYSESHVYYLLRTIKRELNKK